MAKKKSFLGRVGHGIKKFHRETFRIIDQGLGVGNKIADKIGIDKVIGGGKIGASDSSGSRGGSNVYYQPANNSNSIGYGISNNTGTSSFFVNNQAVTAINSVEKRIAERDELLREAYGAGYIPESSQAIMAATAVGTAVLQVTTDIAASAELIGQVYYDNWAIIYSANDTERTEAFNRNIALGNQITGSISNVIYEPTIITNYYTQRADCAAKSFENDYLRGNLIGAGASAGQVLYDTSGLIGIGNSVSGFAVKSLPNVVQQTSNFMASHNFRAPITFNYNNFKVNSGGRLNSGFPFDAVEVRNPVTSVKPKLSSASVKLTKKHISEYLENIDKIPLEQLLGDLEIIGFKILEYRPDKKIYKLSHVKNELRGTVQAKANLKSSKFILEIHCDSISGPHMHINDAYGNVYDKYLNNLTAKYRKEHPTLSDKIIEKRVERLPGAHISIKEFVELNMRPANE